MDIRESLDLILQWKGVLGELFYDRLLNLHPELGKYFEGVDLRRQAVLLTMQLTVIESYYRHRSLAAREYLHILGTKHSDRGVPREAYPKFRDVLLETLHKFHGQDWDEQLASQWKEAIDAASEQMFAGYAERYHV